METPLFEKYDGHQLTDPMLQAAAHLFSSHYGVWSPHAAPHLGDFAKAGTPVKLRKQKLQAEYLPPNTTCSYARVTVGGILAGNVFACRWVWAGRKVCWVTQLVVRREFRERGLATGLLQLLGREEDDDVVYGVVSAHPAACLAAGKAFGGGVDKVRLECIKEHAEGIMKASPVRYVKEAKVRGRLFETGDEDGLVSCVDTGFWVDHTEPLEALARARDGGEWPLGELCEGCEFLFVVEGRRSLKSESLRVGGES